MATILLPRADLFSTIPFLLTVSSQTTLSVRDTFFTYCILSKKIFKLSFYILNYMIDFTIDPLSLPCGMIISWILEAKPIWFVLTMSLLFLWSNATTLRPLRVWDTFFKMTPGSLKLMYLLLLLMILLIPLYLIMCPLVLWILRCSKNFSPNLWNRCKVWNSLGPFSL